MSQGKHVAAWVARVAVGTVFFFNVTCALAFVLWPERYVPAFELDGVAGRVLVRGIGILFLMWNATYPLVLYQPQRHRVLFGVLLVQQAIGLVGETWMWMGLPPGHATLSAAGLRFIVFDGAGLVLMLAAFWFLVRCARRQSA